jgi:CDP-glucose 4,6-dehydratase
LRNPDSIRPWQHVLEPLSGYLLLGIKLFEMPDYYSGSFNFGPHLQSGNTVRRLTECIIEEYGNGSFIETVNKNANHEAKLLKLDISKSISVLEWRPVLTFNETIIQTTYWYKNYTSGGILDISIQQIEEYMGKCR